MSDKFNEQKDTLISIKKEISLLHQQVDYLIRNEKPLELLDLDVMMNRTHTIYSMMCGVEVGNQQIEDGGQDEELPVGLDAIREMFGITETPEEVQEKALDEDLEEDLEEEPAEPITEEETVEENESAYFIDEADDEPAVEEEKTVVEEEKPAVEEEKPVVEEKPIVEEESPAIEEESPIIEEEKPAVEEEPVIEEENPKDRDDFGFILNFEPITTTEPVQPLASSYSPGDEIEMSIPHMDIPQEDPSDNDYEIETIGDKLQQEQTRTLADKYEQAILTSLQHSIGINDKFLFVNELFNGSMEKYNRSIGNLDDLKTLNGALIYLNELRVELQWNSSNEAYKKLLELVHRKFNA